MAFQLPSRLTQNVRIGSWWPVAALLAAALLAAPWLVGPACPQRVVMASGDPQGAYHRFALRYREILARDGVELVVKPSSGAAENLTLLSDRSGSVTLALFQGGVVERAAGVETLASVYLEPVWVFARRELPLQRLTDLAGRRIAVGAVGSGTRPLAERLLSANGVQPRRAGDTSGAVWLPWGGAEAAAALETGRADAAFLVTAVDSPLVKRLIGNPSLQLMSFSRGDAYEANFRYLSTVTLPEGAVDLGRNWPPQAVQLLAPVASVIARDDLHAALVPLMMQALEETHGPGEVLSPPGDFPSAHHATFPLRPLSRHYLQYGPSALYRVFPFWIAAWIDRTKLLLLPLFTLLLPALRLAPPIYRWRVRRRIYRWYGMVRDVDEQIRAGAVRNPRQARRRLDRIDHAIKDVAVPMGYMEEFFNLRQNLDGVRARLDALAPAARPRPRAA